MDSTFKIDGGLFIATGSSGMMQSPSDSSTQNILSINFEKTLNSAVCIKDLIGILPSKNYQSLIISTPNIIKNNSYKIYTECTVIGDGLNGIYKQFNLGELYKTVNISNTITTIGNQGGMGNIPGMIPGRR